MYLAPEHVRPDALEAAQFVEDSPYLRKEFAYDGGVYWDFAEVTANGALGDARKASREFGEEMNKLVVRKISTVSERIILPR